jgi:hypothetical protein
MISAGTARFATLTGNYVQKEKRRGWLGGPVFGLTGSWFRPPRRHGQLPTARTHLQAGWLVLPADLQAIIDAGQGDRPLKDLRFRCAKCGSRMTDSVIWGRAALACSRGGPKGGDQSLPEALK